VGIGKSSESGLKIFVKLVCFFDSTCIYLAIKAVNFEDVALVYAILCVFLHMLIITTL